MRRWLAPAIAAAVLGACSGTGATMQTEVELYDGTIEASSTALQAGAVTIDIVNEGEFDHTLVITSGDGRVVAATELIPAGGVATLFLDMVPGHYQFTCRIVAQSEDGQIFDHYQMGMTKPVTVAG